MFQCSLLLSCIVHGSQQYTYFRFYLRFPAFLEAWWRVVLLWLFASALTPPLRSLRAWKYACSPCELFSSLRCWCWHVYVFNPFLPFFDFHFGHRLFHPVFSFGYCVVSSFSVPAATRWAYDMFLFTYVRWFHVLIFLRYTIFFSYCEYCLLFLFVFSWGNCPRQSFRSLSCDHGLHWSDELMWEPQQRHPIIRFRSSDSQYLQLRSNMRTYKYLLTNKRHCCRVAM